MKNSIALSVLAVIKNCRTTLERTLQSVARINASRVDYGVIDGLSTDGNLGLLRSAGDLVFNLVSAESSGRWTKN